MPSRSDSTETFLDNTFLQNWLYVSLQLRLSSEQTQNLWQTFGSRFRLLLPQQHQKDRHLPLSAPFRRDHVWFTPWPVTDLEGLVNAAIHSQAERDKTLSKYLVLEMGSSLLSNHPLFITELIQKAAEHFESTGDGVYLGERSYVVLDTEKDPAWNPIPFVLTDLEATLVETNND